MGRGDVLIPLPAGGGHLEVLRLATTSRARLPLGWAHHRSGCAELIQYMLAGCPSSPTERRLKAEGLGLGFRV